MYSSSLVRFLPLSLWCIVAMNTPCSHAAEQAAVATSQADAFQNVARERSEKIVATLNIADAALSGKVTRDIADHYLTLHRIDEVRASRLKQIKDDASLDKAAKLVQNDIARDQATLSRYNWHFEFIARLSTELAPEQIEKVKDGLTYGVLPLTYRVYQEMYPQLSNEQKAQILTWLTEAREHAMDGGSSEEKHGWFGKYKGRINNHLSAAGFDAKKAENELQKNKPTSRNDSPAKTSTP